MEIAAQMLSIKFLKGAALEHINVRKQGNEDDAFMALDLKLSGGRFASKWGKL